MRRRVITWVTIGVGTALVVVGYFVLAAPWGASGVDNSNPRMQFAPLLVVLGIALVFASAVVYELLSDRRKQ